MEPNVHVERIGERVELTIDIPVPFYEVRKFPFSFVCSSEAYAGFLTHAISKELNRHNDSVQKLSYLKGWNDAKNRRRKFSSFL